MSGQLEAERLAKVWITSSKSRFVREMLRDYGARKLSLEGPVVFVYSTATTEDILTNGGSTKLEMVVVLG